MLLVAFQVQRNSILNFRWGFPIRLANSFLD
jgi:hypothetical protein